MRNMFIGAAAAALLAAGAAWADEETTTEADDDAAEEAAPAPAPPSLGDLGGMIGAPTFSIAAEDDEGDAAADGEEAGGETADDAAETETTE